MITSFGSLFSVVSAQTAMPAVLFNTTVWRSLEGGYESVQASVEEESFTL